ncbi:hypothetical protein D3M70_12445 [Pseudomonas sp. LS-2]|nr:hypothetical protein D3M70_12445 [Pseudomonas sp. LS-2]
MGREAVLRPFGAVGQVNRIGRVCYRCAADRQQAGLPRPSARSMVEPDCYGSGGQPDDQLLLPCNLVINCASAWVNPQD